MKIKLLNEWMGHPKGGILDLYPDMATKIVNRGQAEEVVEDGPEEKGVEESEEKEMVRSDIEDKEYRSGKTKTLKRRRR